MNKILSLVILTFLAIIFSPKPLMAALPENFQLSTVVGSGLEGPSGFEIAPDGRIFILERTGKVKIVKDGELLTQEFVILPAVASGDRGLIGIAFDPEFNVSNHFVYFYYTDADLLNRLVRFDASSDIAANGPILIYKTTSPSQELHVGGSIRFGPDGKLYFAVGDNGYPPNAQDLSNPHGKILRINKDGSIPMDNPFVGDSGDLPEIWAYGMRNPWRFQFDSENGKLYGGDVGDFTWEEINLIEKGKNYGWPLHEGMCESDCAGYTDPIFAYDHNNESAAVTGGPVYRGSMFPQEYVGSLFFGDYAAGFIRRLTFNAGGNVSGSYDFDLNAGSVVDLKVASDGSLYYINFYPGRLYRITYTTENHVPVANATSDVDKGIEPLTVNFSSSGSSDPDGSVLSYLWDFGDGTTSTEANPTKTYELKGNYTVELTVSDGVNSSAAIPLVIQVGIPPTVNIGEPNDGSFYRAGDSIHWTASALDGAGFDIDDRDLTTHIIFHHGTHTHPFEGPIIGRQGTFTVPTSGEAAADTYFEIKVRATDKNGLYSEKSVFVYPIISQMTFTSSVPGLKILIDGSPYSTPLTLDGVVNFQREISVPSFQEMNGIYYQFVSWDHTDSANFTLITPETDTVYNSNFKVAESYSGEYFNNTDLQGVPELIRIDSDINFIWGSGSPDPAIQTDNFSVRWTRSDHFAGGTYKFTTATDDGVRLFIDGELLIDEWHGNTSSFSAKKYLGAGNHQIVMEYMELSGLASASLKYELTNDPPPPIEEYFTEEYFSGRILSGIPIYTRESVNINYDWGGGSPDASVPVDDFSARFSKSENFDDGEYEFTVTADDGVRLYIDGILVLDKWVDQAPTTYKIKKTLTAGSHDIKIEYYEAGGGAVIKFFYQKAISETPPTESFRADFYGNKDLFGTPVYTADYIDINFDWGGGSPDPTVPVDDFSARFVKSENFAEGNYEFTVTADDGFRLYIDGESVLDKWVYQAQTTYKVQKYLSAGDHTLTLEYFEAGGGAVLEFSFAASVETLETYNVSYFNNRTLTAPIVYTTEVSSVDFDWGGGSPHLSVNVDNFSARFAKTSDFEAGEYEFTVTADDGVRLIIDGVIILDKWIDQPPTTYTIQKSMLAGSHDIVLEYYEAGGGAVVKLKYEKISTDTTSNMVLNYGFENLTSGWANNWYRDNDSFSIDQNSNGNQGTNSLHLVPNFTLGHVFSENIELSEISSAYIWSQYIDASGSGDFGFYIDEYDENGNWISGQWKGMLDGAFTGFKEFVYTPTSSLVKSVGLQYYVHANSNFMLFLDSISFYFHFS
jgi:glucose/arabinose dehydrogenase